MHTASEAPLGLQRGNGGRGSTRTVPGTTGLRVAGPSLRRELGALRRVAEDPKRPLVAVVGGPSKVISGPI